VHARTAADAAGEEAGVMRLRRRKWKRTRTGNGVLDFTGPVMEYMIWAWSWLLPAAERDQAHENWREP
jgi:hypothetical protein